jgi:hypothetical protein
MFGQVDAHWCFAHTTLRCALSIALILTWLRHDDLMNDFTGLAYAKHDE